MAEKLSRKEIDKLTEWIKAYGAKGLAWTQFDCEWREFQLGKIPFPRGMLLQSVKFMGAETGDGVI